MASIRTSILILPFLLGAAAYGQEAFELNLQTQVMGQPSSKAKSFGNLERFAGKPMQFSEVPGKPEWRKITSPSGAFAFVETKALTKVEVKPGYGVRAAADGAASREGATGKTNIVYTGKSMKDAKGNVWKEVWANGKVGYVSAAASIKAVANVSSPTKATESVKTPVPALTTATKPTASAGVVPAPATPSIPNTKPVEITKAPEKPAAIVEAKPKPVEPDCVSTPEQYAESERIKKAFGTATPFTKWEGDLGLTIEPSGNKWILTIPTLVMTMMPNPPASSRMPVPMKVCADKTGRPFINVFNQNKYFDDANAAQVTIRYSDRDLTFKRGNVSR